MTLIKSENGRRNANDTNFLLLAPSRRCHAWTELFQGDATLNPIA
jgi:hypothetical protein